MKTKFGKAKIYNGYYYIISRKEGNCNKLLHRLIWEDFYGTKIPEGYHIHHKNGNKLDNCILNLQLLSESDHIRLHRSGTNLSEEHKQQISKSLKDKCCSEEYKQKIIKNLNHGYGENNIAWKNYARIIKKGFKNNKQIYSIKYEGKYLKYSFYIHKLYKWFAKNYPNEYLYFEAK